MVGASFLLGKRLRAAAKLKREIEIRIQAHIQQTLTGIPVASLHARGTRESSISEFADAAIRSQQRSAVWEYQQPQLGSHYNARFRHHSMGRRKSSWPELSMEVFFSFSFISIHCRARVKVFTGLYTTLQGLSASVHRTVEVLDTPPEVMEKPDAKPLPPVRGNVRFDNLTTGYEKGRPVLKKISLEVQAGQTIAFVGATGVGKTTLVNLIPRFADAWEGRVLIDGHDVRDVQLKSLRDQIAIVLQEPFVPISIAKTSLTAGRTQRVELKPLRARANPRSSSPHCLKATTLLLANAARPCPAANGNVWRSLALC
jgi:ATP-binding cassette subfamily B protein/subfamily B ATP-binding cassette protein MsbA